MRLKDEKKVVAIYNAIMYLIDKEGFGGLTMGKIAKQANLAIGTLYIYFESKELLINALYMELQEKAMIRFFAGYDKAALFEDRIKRIWFNYYNHRVHFHKESVFLEQYYRSPYITKEQRAIAFDLKTPVIELLQEGQKLGILKPNIEAIMLFQIILGFIREVADEHCLGTHEISEESTAVAFKLSWESIRL